MYKQDFRQLITLTSTCTNTDLEDLSDVGEQEQKNGTYTDQSHWEGRQDALKEGKSRKRKQSNEQVKNTAIRCCKS